MVPELFFACFERDIFPKPVTGPGATFLQLIFEVHNM
jgi:hypothetical protein